MKPAPFDYARPSSVDDAVALLSGHGDRAKVLAGGQSLMAMMNLRLATPELIVDINGVQGLDQIRVADGALEVGANVTQEQLLNWSELAQTVTLLAAALPHVGHYQTRQRGTICGSLAHADPSAEMPLILRHLDGEVIVRNSRSTRRVPAKEFQAGMMSTALEPGELIIGCRFPVPNKATSLFREVSQRPGDFAMVAMAVSRSGNGVRVTVGGVGDRPQSLDLSTTELSSMDEHLNEFAWGLGASDDVHATARYRRQLVRRLGRKMIDEVSA